jgi:hypothetical protein
MLPTWLVVSQQTSPAWLKLVPVVQIIRRKAAHQHRIYYGSWPRMTINLR